jgi:hypothetical protein
MSLINNFFEKFEFNSVILVVVNNKFLIDFECIVQNEFFLIKTDFWLIIVDFDYFKQLSKIDRIFVRRRISYFRMNQSFLDRLQVQSNLFAFATELIVDLYIFLGQIAIAFF